MYLDLESSIEFQKGFDTQLTGDLALRFKKAQIYEDSNNGGTCSVMIENNLVIFGGITEKRQISVIYPTGIYRLQTLDFEFYEGRCVYQDGAVYLCFSVDMQDSCMKRYFFV